MSSSHDLQVLAEQMLALTARSSSDIEDSLHSQKLYEKWLRNDDWALFSEAIPLLLGQDPATWSLQRERADVAELDTRFRTFLQRSVAETRQPPVPNADATADTWRVRPTDAYQWAVAQGLMVPEPFARLAQFIMQTLKREPMIAEVEARTMANPLPAQAGDRERVLGAALNLIAKCPEKCRDENGFLSGSIVVDLMLEQSVRWFDNDSPPLTPEQMAEIIDQWLD